METVFFILMLISTWEKVQDQMNPWRILSKVKFVVKYDKKFDDMVFKPIFNAHAKALDGKTIYLKGYNITGSNQHYVLSCFPKASSSCSLCGGLSPEYLVSVETKESIKIQQNKSVTWEGTLTLNDTDPNEFIYILKNAKLISKPN